MKFLSMKSFLFSYLNIIIILYIYIYIFCKYHLLGNSLLLGKLEMNYKGAMGHTHALRKYMSKSKTHPSNLSNLKNQCATKKEMIISRITTPQC